jgi:hypothetical protein
MLQFAWFIYVEILFGVALFSMVNRAADEVLMLMQAWND